MTRADKIAQALQAVGFEDVLTADGLDDAMVGITINGIAVYDADKCVEVMARDNDMSTEEADEFLWFNTFTAHVGEKTPIFVYNIDKMLVVHGNAVE